MGPFSEGGADVVIGTETGVQLRVCGSFMKCSGECLDCGDKGWLLELW